MKFISGCFQTTICWSGEPEEIRDCPEIYSMSVFDLGEMTARLFSVLQGEEIETVGQLMQRSEEHMLQIRNFGETTLNELRHLLSNHRLEMKPRMKPRR